MALQLTGKLEACDCGGIGPILEERVAQHGKIRLLWEMRDFGGWTVGGLVSDTMFDVKHANDFTRIALVGEKRRHELMTGLMKPFTSSAEVKYFDLHERESALAWASQSPAA